MITYRFRIYPTEQQKQILENTLEYCRLLYNNCLEERNKIKITANEQRKKLTTIDKKGIYAQVLQDVVLRLDKSFKRFFSKKSKYPKFKRCGRYNSFTYPQYGGFQIKNNKLMLSKIGLIKLNIHRILMGTMKTCTVIRKVDRWFVCIVTTYNYKKSESSSMVGIDVGLTNWLTLSTGEVITKPRFMTQDILNKIKNTQKELSRKKLGSKNRNKIRIRLAKIWRKVTLQREDYCNKISNYLAKKYGIIIFEKLTIQNMTKQYTLANSILDSTWYKLKRLAAYKAEVIEIDPRDTTRICSNCDNKQEYRLKLSTRIYNCKNCGLEIDRDYNAAKNILKLGQELALVERKPLSK